MFRRAFFCFLPLEGGIFMMTNKNEAIGCTVNNCTHHAQGENYCTLNKIQIGTHESNPTKIECTDCESFVNKAQ